MSTLGKRRSRGATLVEFMIISSMLLGPALLLTPVLGKMIAGKHKYEQGLRYAAWERIAWHETRPRYVDVPAVKSSSDLAMEVQTRIFGRSRAPIRNDDRSRTLASESEQDYILYRPTGVNTHAQQRGYRPWMVSVSQDDNRPRYGSATQSKAALNGVASQAQVAGIEGLERLTRFNVDTRSVYTTRLQADLEDLGSYKEFRVTDGNTERPIDLRLDRENGAPRQLLLLADGWNVARREHAADQARALLPTDLLNNRAVDSALNIISYLFIARELDDLEFGKVDTERTPAHRLGRYQ